MRLKPISKQARDVTITKVLDGSWSAVALGKLLKELAAYDVTVESRKRVLKIWVNTAIGLGVAGWIGGIALLSIEQLVVAIAVMVAVVAHIAVAVTIQAKDKPGGLPPEPLQTLHKFFRQIQADIDPAKKVHARIDLTGVTPAKRVSEKPLDPAGFVSRTETIYADPWCQLHFQMRDGSAVSVRIVDQHTDLDRVRLNRLGRQKSKRKYRKITRITTSLQPRGGTVWANQPKVDADWERLKVSRKRGQEAAVLDRWSQAKDRFLRPKVTPTGNELVGMLFRLCSMRPVEAR